MKRLRLRQNFPSDSNRAVVIILFNSNIPERLIKNNCPSRCYCVVLRNIQFSTNRAAVTSFWQRRKDQSTMFASTFPWHDVTAHTFPSYRYKSPNFFSGFYNMHATWSQQGWMAKLTISNPNKRLNWILAFARVSAEISTILKYDGRNHTRPCWRRDKQLRTLRNVFSLTLLYKNIIVDKS